MNMKVVGGLVAAVVVVIAIALSVLVQNVDGIVKGLIEEIGTEVTGTKVTVGEVVISLTDGSGTIRGLKVSNPAGFSKSNIFEIDEVSLVIDSPSLMDSVYVIDEVIIDGARVRAEQNTSTTNIEVIMKNVESASSSESGQSESAEPVDSSTSEGSADIQLMVGEFNFSNSSAKLVMPVYGEQALQIPAIRLTNIGSREDGLTPDELAEEVIGALVKEVEKAVKDEIQTLVEDAAKEAATEAIESKLSEEDKEKIGVFKSLFKKK